MLPIRSLVSDTAHGSNADVRRVGSCSGSDFFNAQELARSLSTAPGRIYRAIRDLEVRDDPERQASPVDWLSLRQSNRDQARFGAPLAS
jgi:hypothetical protein